MANGYYNHGTWPASNSAGASAPARAELDAVTSGFGLLPNPLGTGQQGFTGGQWTNPLIIGQSGGGSIDAIPIGASTPSTASFTSLGASGAVSFSGGGSIAGSYSGAPTFSGNVAFTGTPTFSGIDVNGGAIDATPIGSTTRSTGAFTTLGANGAVTFSSGGTLTGTFTGGTHTSTAITSSTIDNTPIGAATRSTGLFTTLGANGAVTFTSTTALSGGGSLAGTFSGSPTFSGTPNFSGSPPTVGGSPVLVAGTNLNDVANKTTARANLGVGMVLISTQTVSAGADVEFTPTSEFDAYQIVFKSFSATAPTGFFLFQGSIDGGSTWLLGGSNLYAFAYNQINMNAGTSFLNSSASNGNITLIGGALPTSAAQSLNGVIDVYDPLNSTFTKSMTFRMNGYAQNVPYTTTGGGILSTTSAVNKLRLVVSTGTMSGEFSFYGIKQ